MQFFLAHIVKKWGSKCRAPRTFLCAVNTQLFRNVALRSVNNFFPESYYFAANNILGNLKMKKKRGGCQV
jgi:hypothetical protein